MLLAIDTATTTTGLALFDGVQLIAECTWHSGRDHSAQLLPQLDLLVRHTGLQPAAIDTIAIALGPGSWSGLRVGLSVAKALVLANGSRLIGVNTLEALAAQHLKAAMPIFPLIRLGRDRYATARFEGGTPRRKTEDHNTTLAELCATIEGNALFCGDLAAETRQQLNEYLGKAARFPGPLANLRRPAALAELAWQRRELAQFDDPVTLEPIYLGAAVKEK